MGQYPQLAEELNAILPALNVLTDCEIEKRVTTAGKMGVSDRTRLGDFLILREIGRGGMGVVYEALQISLNRPVALKVLPFASVLDPRDIQRFKNEAQIAAQLHHAHIVPVYAVGCEQGVHFYAMQLVEGQSVAELIREISPAEGRQREGEPSTITQKLPAAPANDTTARDSAATASTISSHASHRDHFRAIAWLGIQAAQALQYAHSIGLVHRDVKPSNLLIDRRGTLWVSDFGLAKVATGSQLTLSGDLIGTLAYMSPEQTGAAAGIVDHRSDIYSLGATLYELAALRKPFESDNRLELLQQVAHGHPPRLRHINRSIPVDLETIVHKALAKDAADRYPSAQEFADDLQRFLDSRPIRARRPSLLDRGGKWVQRHRLLVALVALFLILSTAGSIAATAIVLGQKTRADAALAREQSASLEARKQSRIARQAVDEMYTEVVVEWLEEVPHMTSTEEKFLEKALDYYEHFSRTSAQEEGLEESTALALLRSGTIQLKLDRNDLAEPRLAEAGQRLRQLLDQEPTSVALGKSLLEANIAWATALENLARRDEAQQALRQAAELVEDLLEAAPEDEELRLIRLRIAVQLSEIHVKLHQFDLAEQRLRQALEREQRDSSDEAESDRAMWLASLLLTFSRLEINRYKSMQAMGYLNRAADYLAVAESAGPPSRALRELQRTLAHRRARTYDGLGLFADAQAAIARAWQVSRELQADFPDIPEYAFFAASDAASVARHMMVLEQYGQAEQQLTDSLATFTQLIADNPQTVHYRDNLAFVHKSLGLVSMNLGKSQQAVAHFERAIELETALVDELPDVELHARCLSCTMGMYALFLVLTPDEEFRDPIKSETLARRGLELSDCVDSQTALGMALYRQGRYEEAVDQLEYILEAGPSNFKPHILLFLALAYHALDLDVTANCWYERADSYIARGFHFPDPYLMRLMTEVAQTLGVAKSTEGMQSIEK